MGNWQQTSFYCFVGFPCVSWECCFLFSLLRLLVVGFGWACSITMMTGIPVLLRECYIKWNLRICILPTTSHAQREWLTHYIADIGCLSSALGLSLWYPWTTDHSLYFSFLLTDTPDTYLARVERLFASILLQHLNYLQQDKKPAVLRQAKISKERILIFMVILSCFEIPCMILQYAGQQGDHITPPLPSLRTAALHLQLDYFAA